MCVIILKDEGIVLPQEKLAIACDINKDGFGYSFIERKKIVTVRSTSKNDSTQLGKELLKLKNKKVFLHLRHATVGTVTMENSHPFFPLTRNDGLEVGFMHNGTLFKYKPNNNNGVSDSYVFNRDFLRPILLRAKAFNGKVGPLADDLLPYLLKTEIAYGESVFLLFDNQGRVLKAGKEGTQHEGWWSSNTYSFDEQHQRSSSRDVWPSTGYIPIQHRHGSSYDTSGTDDGLPFEIERVSDDIQWSTFSEQVERIERNENLSAAYCEKTSKQMKRVSSLIIETARGVDSMVDTQGNFIHLESSRQTFLKQADLKTYHDLTRLTISNFADLCHEYPDAMAELFVDLIAERERFGLDVPKEDKIS